MEKQNDGKMIGGGQELVRDLYVPSACGVGVSCALLTEHYDVGW